MYIVQLRVASDAENQSDHASASTKIELIDQTNKQCTNKKTIKNYKWMHYAGIHAPTDNAGNADSTDTDDTGRAA